MRLPNLENAEVSEAKITRYLLNPEHETGRAKAAFFLAFGFSPAAPEVMEAALLEHATRHEVTEIVRLRHGVHYVIDGSLNCPDGRSPQVRVIWRIDEGNETPRLITAYPGD